MIVHTMTHAEMVAEARKDFPALRNKTASVMQRMRREHLRDRKQTLVHMFPWRSPNRNHWLILLHYSKQAQSTYTLTWFRDKEERIAALWTTHAGLAFYIDSHVIQRYGERFDPTDNPAERLQSFFLENHFYSMQLEEPRGEQHWNVSVGMNHGLGLGEWDTVTNIVHVRTFVNHGQLFPEQEQKMDLMDFERLYYTLTPGQRIDLHNRIRLAEEEERRRAA